MTRQMYTVYFYGYLKDTYGAEPVRLSAGSLRDVFRGLSSRFGESFRRTILDGAWHITKGTRTTEILSEEDNFITEHEVDFPVGEEEIHIFPAIMGAGGKAGTLQIIVGVVLIVAGILLAGVTGGWSLVGVKAGFAASGLASSLAIAGVVSVIGGVAQMLSKTPTMGNYANQSTDKRQSFLFNGAVNNTEEGVPVPLVFGRYKCGSTVISAGIEVYKLTP